MFFLIQEGVERFGHRALAFCLMDNHIHLAIQVSDFPLSRTMQNLSFRHSHWINSRHQRMGHLFQGRYKALLVSETEQHALAKLARCVHKILRGEKVREKSMKEVQYRQTIEGIKNRLFLNNSFAHVWTHLYG